MAAYDGELVDLTEFNGEFSIGQWNVGETFRFVVGFTCCS